MESSTSQQLPSYIISDHCFIGHYCAQLFNLTSCSTADLEMERVTKLASERPVVIFSKSTCCMCHTIKTLFCDFGVNPAVHELDEMPGGREIEQALSRAGCPTLPAVFIGGEIVGGANEVMSLHLSRSLIPMLKHAGALWV